MFDNNSCERAKTRKLLHTWDPYALGLKSIYPWENLSLNILMQKLYKIAVNSGFNGEEQDFYNNFGSFMQEKQIIMDNFDNFPEIGQSNKLYFDTDKKILYYWDEEYLPVNTNSSIED